MNRRKKLIVMSITIVSILLVSILAVGYAWFNATVTTSGNNSVIVDAAELGTITYYTGNEINVDGIYPGWCETKRVSIVSSNATVSNSYVINLNVVTNELAAKGSKTGYITMQSTVVSGSTGTGTRAVTDIISTSGTAEILRGTLPANGTHTYDIEFCFPEKGSDQNSQQGKRFNAYITVEMNYFAQDSWEVIVKNVQNGNTDRYNVGDTKEVTLGNGLGTHTLRVANKTTTSDCADSNISYSQTACGFVLEFADIITTHAMRTDEKTNVGGWPALTASVGGMRSYVNDDVYNALPDELRTGIIDTRVISGYENVASANYTTTDKLYLLSFVELLGSNISGDSVTITVTRQLDYYHNLGVTGTSYKNWVIKRRNGSPNTWWMRSAIAYSNNGVFGVIQNDGAYSNRYATSSSGASPAFRIG